MKKIITHAKKHPKLYQIILFFWGLYRNNKLIKITKIVTEDFNTSTLYDLDI